MKKTEIHEAAYPGLIGVALIGLAIGLLLIILPVEWLLKAVFVIAGGATILCNLPGLVSGLLHFSTRAGQIAVMITGISIFIGFLMIFFHSDILMIVLGVYLLVLPMVRILISRDRGRQFKIELPKMLLGLVLVLIGPGKALEVLFDIVGWVLTVLTVAYVVWVAVDRMIRTKKAEHTTGNRLFVDQNGDGTVDSIYVDTTGDGKPDTEKRYRNGK